MAKQGEENHERIRAATRDIVIVDGHAHNLVDLDSSFSFLHAFAEAGDDVLGDIHHTIPFKRGIEDVAGLYEIEASLKSIEEHRKVVELRVLSEKCFEAAKIGTVLLDDGIAFDKMKALAWHKGIIKNVHRILRIETVAEDLLKQDPPAGLKHWNFKVLEEQFLSSLKSQLPNVVGFKSIAAYRSGLNIDPTVTDFDAEEGLWKDISLSIAKKKPVRLQSKKVIDLLFTKALELATSHGIPVQLHTGFGDKDLDLRLANPLHLRSVLDDRRFTTARLVLLHASYPYMREATYLASVYPQVFLDFGLAIPKLTVRGMKSAVAELLELAPINKVMFSTDGYAFPETFFLGAKWARTVLAQVLCEACDDGDLSIDEAISAAEALLRKNSLAFYKLQEESGETVSSDNSTQGLQSKAWKDFENEAEKRVNDTLRHKGDSSGIGKFHRPTSWLDNVKYVRLLWGDGSGKRRCRVVPTARYKATVAENGVGLTHACMGMSSFSDGPADGSGLTGVGEIRLIPDATTAIEVPEWGHGLVLVDMHEKPGTPWEYCPRNTLRRLIELLNKEFGLVLKAGFEAEFYLLKKIQGVSNVYEGVDATCYCSTNGLNESLPTIEKILSWLETFEVDIEQFHAEGGGGQFEFALAYDTALKIADKLFLAREAITTAASSQNLIATFLPKLQYSYTAFGSGSHCHLSLWREGQNVFGADAPHGLSETGKHFMAGVLEHLPAVLAFTAPHPASYRRIQPNTWSGAYQCWGQQNREAPIRTILDDKTGVVSNFELKSFDGCANPHLGLAAVLAAGLDGLRKKLELHPPIDVNPAELEIGEVLRLPTRLEEATEQLENNTALKELLGEKLVTAIVAIRKSEAEYIEQRGYDHFGTQEVLIRNY